MKRWLVLFWLILVAAATFTPCCGMDDCCTDGMNYPSQQKKEGACSPFFACASCTVAIVLPAVMQPAIPPEQLVVHHHTIVTSQRSGYLSSCWQPPRFC